MTPNMTFFLILIASTFVFSLSKDHKVESACYIITLSVALYLWATT